jgi:phosphate transport system substrate-binding protein
MRRACKSNVFLVVMMVLMVAPVLAEQLRWVGCGICKKAFINEMAATYEKEKGVKVVIEGGGATKGIRAVAAGNADIGGTCRHSIDVPEEKGAKLHHVAWDALVVVVHQDNPVDNISTPKLEKLLKGDIKNWKDLGGPDLPVTLFARKGKVSGVGLMTRELIFKDPQFNYRADAVKKKSSGPVEKAVTVTKGGIGITGVSSARKRPQLKILKVNGVYPSKGALRSGRYAYIRPLYLVTTKQPSEAVKQFIDFTLSSKGQAVISAQGTVNLEEGVLCKKKFVANYKGKFYEKPLN